MQSNTSAHTNEVASLTHVVNLHYLQLCVVKAYAGFNRVTEYYMKSSFLGITFHYLLVFDMHDLALGIFVLTMGHQDSAENMHWINKSFNIHTLIINRKC